MEKSDHYYLKRERMKNLIVPTISEVKSVLGENLSEAFFSQCPDPLKPDMGLAPPLKGAGEDLWISPSDVLIGHVCLKPPLTNKHMKALTHQGILSIGRDIEIKSLNQAELEKIKALAEQEEMLTFIAELGKRKAVEAARKEEQKICAEEKEQKRIEFEKRLQYELQQLENRLRKEYELLMKQQKEQLDNEWQIKLEAAVAETVVRLTEQFLKDLEAQEKELLRKFAVEIKKEQIKRKMDVKHVQECCQETFLQLKHQLECKNIANMMYILCMERRKCQSEREHMEANYQKQVQDLQALVTEKEVEITKLTKDRDEKTKQVNLREECLLEILRQFQKFINFALRASPTQAEFLLSIEKMMMFELTQAIAKTDKKHAKRLARTLFPWKTESDTTTTTLSFKESLKSLRADDHHECYNELEPPLSDHSCASADYLPAFHYDKHMYVREEFRNMMSQGIKLSPSNMIWNRDVEHLMEVLRRSVTSTEAEQIEAEESGEEKEEETGKVIETKEKQVEIKEELKIEKQDSLSSSSSFHDEPSSTDTKTRPPRRSIVYFRPSKDDEDFLFPIFESNSTLNTTASEMYREMSLSVPVTDFLEDPDMILEKECCKPCVIPRPNYQPPVTVKERESAVPLIGTRNSLELLKELEKGDSLERDHTLDQLEGTGILSARDSLHKHRMSLKPTNIFLSSRESVHVSEVIALNKKSRHSSSIASSIINRTSKESGKESVVDRNSSLRKTSRDSKIHFCLKDEPSFRRSLEDSTKHLSSKKKDILTMSKLSLARDSFIVHKRSTILKQRSKSSLEGLIDLGSQETLQLTKPTRYAQDSVERTSLKKLSKSHLPNEMSSYHNISAATSTASPARSPRTQSPTDLRFPTSKLTMSRDSLDILRSQSKVSAISHDKHKAESKESIEIKNGILAPHLQSAQLSPPIIKLDDDGSRTVKMSHIEILPLDEQYSTEILDDEQSVSYCGLNTKDVTTDSPWLVYGREDSAVKLSKPIRDNFLTKPNVAQVIGDQSATEHLQKGEEFTIHRVSSLLSIFRKHPSLVKMFTSCTK